MEAGRPPSSHKTTGGSGMSPPWPRSTNLSGSSSSSVSSAPAPMSEAGQKRKSSRVKTRAVSHVAPWAHKNPLSILEHDESTVSSSRAPTGAGLVQAGTIHALRDETRLYLQDMAELEDLRLTEIIDSFASQQELQGNIGSGKLPMGMWEETVVQTTAEHLKQKLAGRAQRLAANGLGTKQVVAGLSVLLEEHAFSQDLLARGIQTSTWPEEEARRAVQARDATLSAASTTTNNNATGGTTGSINTVTSTTTPEVGPPPADAPGVRQEGENDEGGDKRPRRRLSRAIYERVEADLYDIMASSQRISKQVVIKLLTDASEGKMDEEALEQAADRIVVSKVGDVLQRQERLFSAQLVDYTKTSQADQVERGMDSAARCLRRTFSKEVVDAAWPDLQEPFRHELRFVQAKTAELEDDIVQLAMMLTPGRKTDKVHQALESLARVAITDLGLYERLVKQSDEDDYHLSTKAVSVYLAALDSFRPAPAPAPPTKVTNADLKELSKAIRDAAQELYEATIDDDSFMSVVEQLAKEPRVTQKRVHSVVQRSSSLPNKHKVLAERRVLDVVQGWRSKSSSYAQAKTIKAAYESAVALVELLLPDSAWLDAAKRVHPRLGSLEWYRRHRTGDQGTPVRRSKAMFLVISTTWSVFEEIHGEQPLHTADEPRSADLKDLDEQTSRVVGLLYKLVPTKTPMPHLKLVCASLLNERMQGHTAAQKRLAKKLCWAVMDVYEALVDAVKDTEDHTARAMSLRSCRDVQSEEANLDNLQQEEPDPAGAGSLVNNGLPQASNAAVPVLKYEAVLSIFQGTKVYDSGRRFGHALWDMQTTIEGEHSRLLRVFFQEPGTGGADGHGHMYIADGFTQDLWRHAPSVRRMLVRKYPSQTLQQRGEQWPAVSRGLRVAEVSVGRRHEVLLAVSTDLERKAEAHHVLKVFVPAVLQDIYSLARSKDASWLVERVEPLKDAEGVVFAYRGVNSSRVYQPAVAWLYHASVVNTTTKVVSNRPEANFVSCMVKYLLQHPYVLRCVDPNEFQVPQLTGEEVLLRLLAERPAE